MFSDEGDIMCYPCVNCGKCGQTLPPSVVRCPKCKTVLTEEHPVCPQCGWSLPLPPGARTHRADEAARVMSSK